MRGLTTGRRSERGSTLFLFPAGLLIVLLLGAIAVDLGNVWLQQRRLADAADAAANDAVTYAIDQSVLRSDGEVVLDPDRVREVVAVSLAGHDLGEALELTALRIGSDAQGRPTVQVTLASSAQHVFGRFVTDGSSPINASATAVVRDE